MKKLILLPVLFVTFALALPAQAFDFNLINVDLGSNDGQKLNQAYASAYGYTPQQTAPAMLGPAEEVPMIMRIAQAASTVPMTVWMMRRMGMSVGNILSTFALGPSTLMGGGMGNPYSYGGYSPWNNFTNPYMIQTSRVYFLNRILRVPMGYIPQIPFMGSNFARSVIYPYNPVHGTWMPPGIAKKYGLWIPPGQRKKIGWYDGWGSHYDKHHWKEGRHGWGHDWDDHDGDWKFKEKGRHGDDHWEYKGERKGGKEKVEWKSKEKGSKGHGDYLAAKPEKGSGKGSSKGGSSWKGGGSSSHGGGKGKWK